MIPWILIIVGILCIIIGILGLVSLFIYLPLKEKFEVVYDREYDFIRARLDSDIQKYVDHKKMELIYIFLISCIMGMLMFFAGIYLGYSAEGEGFWFYKKFYPESVTNQVWDAINEDGQFVSEDGKAYTYYILISGKEISLSGEVCIDLQQLKGKLSVIRKENTVMLIDSFSVASTYHSIEALLNELGIEYEETR